MFHDLVELSKTPAASALIAALTAIVSAIVTYRLSRKATERQWLRERQGQAYSELLTAMDSPGNAILFVRTNPSVENKQDLRAASDHCLRARSMADIYTSKDVSVLLGKADFAVISSGVYSTGPLALAAIRAKIVEMARSQLGSSE